MNSKIIVTLGMHRSGTSLLSAALECLGVEFGDNLIAPRPDNPKGFWEDEAVVELNDRLYAVLGSFSSALGFNEGRLLGMPQCAELQDAIGHLLEQRLADRTLFGVKDPRLPRLMKVWSQVLDRFGVQSAYVIPLRNPLSVAASLAKRDGFPVSKSLLLWYEHMYRALHFARTRLMVVVDYDAFLEGPRDALLRVAGRLGMDFDEGAYGRFCDQVLDHELRHVQFDREALCSHEDSFPALLRLYDMLCRLARDEVNLSDDACVQEMSVMQEDFASLWPLLRHSGRQDVELWDSWLRGIRERESFAARENELGQRYEALRAAGDGERSGLRRELGQCRNRLDECSAERERLQNYSDALEQQLSAARDEVDNLRIGLRSAEEHLNSARNAHAEIHCRLDAVLSSASWRLTAPLRWGWSALVGKGNC